MMREELLKGLTEEQIAKLKRVRIKKNYWRQLSEKALNLPMNNQKLSMGDAANQKNGTKLTICNVQNVLTDTVWKKSQTHGIDASTVIKLQSIKIFNKR